MNKQERSNKYSGNNNNTINTNNELATVRIDFLLKREVLFVIVGTILGALTFGISKTIFQILPLQYWNIKYQQGIKRDYIWALLVL